MRVSRTCRRARPPLVLLCAAGLLVLAGAGAIAQGASGQKSVREGVYTQAQAQRGEQLFRTSCQSCHLPQEFGVDSYLESWAGESAHALFALVQRTMPEDNPGSLRRQHYADLLAYIFQLSGLPPGDEELRSTEAALKAVRLD